jgi:YfiH family protein
MGNAQDRSVIASHCQKRFSHFITLSQQHSDSIALITQESLSTRIEPEADGVITNIADVALVIRTADCVPIMFYEEDGPWIGISHQGWKGTLAGLAEKMVEVLTAHGVSTEQLRAAIGPAICGMHYLVSNERIALFQDAYPDFASAVSKQGAEGWQLDLAELNRLQLIKSGIAEQNITQEGECTVEHPDRYFSYRADNGNLSGLLMHSIGRYGS